MTKLELFAITSFLRADESISFKLFNKLNNHISDDNRRIPTSGKLFSLRFGMYNMPYITWIDKEFVDLKTDHIQLSSLLHKDKSKADAYNVFNYMYSFKIAEEINNIFNFELGEC